MDQNDEVFTKEESAELSDIQTIRRQLISRLANVEDITKLSGPDKVLLSTLLDGSDRSTFTRAKLRNDKVKDENNKDMLKLAAEMLTRINVRNYRPATPDERVIPANVEERSFVPGELDIGIEPLPIEQIMN